MSFEVVAILFNFHHWTCVVGELALAMTRTKVESCFGLCSQRGGPKLDFPMLCPAAIFHLISPSSCNEEFHSEFAWLNQICFSTPPYATTDG